MKSSGRSYRVSLYKALAKDCPLHMSEQSDMRIPEFQKMHLSPRTRQKGQQRFAFKEHNQAVENQQWWLRGQEL